MNVAALIWVAPAALVADLLEPFGRHEETTMVYTSDLSDGFFDKLWAMCAKLKCAPLDLLACWYSESGLHAAAHNASGGDASGIFQLMPIIARGLGWNPNDATLAGYRALSAEDQLPWAARYYAPHAGQLPSSTACYLANWLPAFLAHASDPTFVLASTTVRLTIYNANRSFDHGGRGSILVADLGAAITRACTGPRWEEIVTRTQASAPKTASLPPSA
jgi:hypothetical protein